MRTSTSPIPSRTRTYSAPSSPRTPSASTAWTAFVFAAKGRLIIGNFGDGSVWRLYLNKKGDRMIDKELWCCDPANLKTTDGMTIDQHGNIYVADFSANAIGKISPDGKIARIAQSPDCTGWGRRP